MENIHSYLNLDNNWIKIKDWWDKIIIDENIFPKIFNKIKKEDKDIFNNKLLNYIKELLNSDLDKLYDIKINDEFINSIKFNIEIFDLLFENDIELKNIISYILKYKKYFKKIKNKIIEIIYPLFNDIYFNKLFIKDDDLSPFILIILLVNYLYIINRNIKKTIKLFLELDPIGINFLIISYRILDNYMDNVNNKSSDDLINNKNIFMKWFNNIVSNPSEKVYLNKEQKKIYQCIIFKKYYELFIEKYPVDKYKFLYDYNKIMIYTLHNANYIQKKKDISEELIMEHSFKKSFMSFFFIILVTNIHLKLEINTNDIFIVSKLLFLIQLLDDYIDINKDIYENNNTYFTLNNINFDNKVKKIIIALFLFIKELNIKNNSIINILNYSIKNIILFLYYYHYDKFNENKIKDYFEEYSKLSKDILKYFNKNSYNFYNDNLIINIIKKNIENLYDYDINRKFI